MKGGFAALNWPPTVFWSATLTEYTVAIEGYNEANGIADKQMPSDAAMDALLAKYG